MKPKDFTIWGHGMTSSRMICAIFQQRIKIILAGVPCNGSLFRKGGSKTPERWLSLTGTMAQFAPEYSNYASFNEISANGIPVWLIERDHIIEFENYLKRCHLKGLYSEITVSNKFYCVISFFKYLYNTRIIPKNIGSIRGITAERYIHRDIPSDDQLSNFFNTIASYSDEPEFDMAFFGSLLHLGLRFCEAGRLIWDDINFQARIIKIRGKGKVGKPVPLHLPKKLYQYFEYLHKISSREGSVFKGTRPEKVFYKKMLDKYRLYAMISGWNFPGGLHLFRHTFITKLSLRKKVHPQLVKRLARHDRLETTSKYLHRQDQELNDAMHKIDSIWR
ncbi:site-specific integrase [Paenibacillus sp. BR2-3]|uniref:tyrosine-type recombinase/integrase n=1 Tax=Paenibacillus sp. BR2-3 TaxID=3048494 RepID=UPI0039778365